MGACLSVCKKSGSGQGNKDASDTQKLEINGQAAPANTNDGGKANKAFRDDEDDKVMGSFLINSDQFESILNHFRASADKYLHVICLDLNSKILNQA